MALLGYTKQCGPRSGGGNSLWIAKVEDVTDVTLAADAESYETITMEAGSQFHQYKFEKDTAVLTMNSSRENGSHSCDTNVAFMMPKLSQDMRDSIQELIDESNCGLIVIFEDNNGVKWLLGYSEKHGFERPLEFRTDEGTTGSALTDANGSTVNLGNTQAEKPRTYTGEIPDEAAA